MTYKVVASMFWFVFDRRVEVKHNCFTRKGIIKIAYVDAATCLIHTERLFQERSDVFAQFQANEGVPEVEMGLHDL